MKLSQRESVAVTGPGAQDGRSGVIETTVAGLSRPETGGSVAWFRSCSEPLPSREAILEAMEFLRAVIFPGYFGPEGLSRKSMAYHMGSVLDAAAEILEIQIQRCLCFSCGGNHDCLVCRRRAGDVVDELLKSLPDIQRLLWEDVEAAYVGDPAAKSRDEVIFCYPGLHALTFYRLAHRLHELGVPMLPRIVTEAAHGATGIDIHPGAEIGHHFFMDHGTGIVVGETCIIGNRVRVYQGVTLGAKKFPLDEEGNPVKGIPRHPILEDDVVVYSGATLLGRITVGRGSVIGGNVWLTRSVPPGSRVLQARVREEVFVDGAGI